MKKQVFFLNLCPIGSMQNRRLHILGYAIVRAVVYRLFPAAHDLRGWSRFAA